MSNPFAGSRNPGSAERALAAMEAQIKNSPGYTPRPDPDAESMEGKGMMGWFSDYTKGDTQESVDVGGLRQTPLLERSPTPIMSNSSSSTKNLKPSNAANDGRDDEMDTKPAPVDTPYESRRSHNQQHRSVTPPTARLFGSAAALTPSPAAPTTPSMDEESFKRYHIALMRYMQCKRNIHRQQELAEEEEQLAGGMATTSTSTVSTGLLPPLEEQKHKAEVGFFQDLANQCYGLSAEDSAVMEEGHAWTLMADLRSLGMDQLLLLDDSGSVTQDETQVEFVLQDIARQVNRTSKEIYESLLSSKSKPLRRKHQLVKWIRSCVGRESKSVKKRLPKSNILVTRSPLSDMDAIDFHNTNPTIKMLMQVSLNEILQGNVDVACQLAREYDCGYKAMAWEGGEPEGYENIVDHTTKTVSRKIVGNERRFLWKYMNQLIAKKLLDVFREEKQDSNSTLLEDAAMRSFLGNNFKTSLENPIINGSWTKSLCVLLSGGWERVVDDVLHRHNNNRRNRPGPAYPGTEFSLQEDFLLDTAKDLAGMKGSQVATFLASTRSTSGDYDCNDSLSYKSTMMAFIVGKSAVSKLCNIDCEKFLKTVEHGSLQNAEWDERSLLLLRFLTHLLLYLDSADLVGADLTGYKNAVLFQYVNYLDSRSDLGEILALYVSCLPDSTILSWYPSILARVSSSSERKIRLEQIDALMPTLEMSLLRKVVRILLGASTPMYGKDVFDVKSNSIKWMLEREEHFADALICSNILVRQLLLEEDKMKEVNVLLDSILPLDFASQVHELLQSQVFEAEFANTDQVEDALMEHRAYADYLSAFDAFQRFADILKMERTKSVVDTGLANLSIGDRSVSRQLSQRDWILKKKELLSSVAGAATEARVALKKMLTHPGGWLSFEPNDSSVVTDEEHRRIEDAGKIRARHLVVAVELYHQVCEETATFMSRAFDEAGNVGLSRAEALPALDMDVSNGAESSSSRISPSYWYKHAKNVVNIVANDAYKIHTIYQDADLKKLLLKIADTAAAELLNQ